MITPYHREETFISSIIYRWSLLSYHCARLVLGKPYILSNWLFLLFLLLFIRFRDSFISSDLIIFCVISKECQNLSGNFEVYGDLYGSSWNNCNEKTNIEKCWKVWLINRNRKIKQRQYWSKRLRDQLVRNEVCKCQFLFPSPLLGGLWSNLLCSLWRLLIRCW